MKKTLMIALALCLLLSGCTGWMRGSYVSVTPHSEQTDSSKGQAVEVSSYLQLRDALAALVSRGSEHGIFAVKDMDPAQLEEHLHRAVRYVMGSDPIGAYAVEEITYEQGQSGNQPAVAVEIRYTHTRKEVLRIPRLSGMEEFRERICAALNNYDSSLVLLVEGYIPTDVAQLVEDYGQLCPDKLVEVPEVTVTTYPEGGRRRVVELKFTYQTNRETLRGMQGRVQAVFDSAKLYVQGDASEHEKFSQLHAFLTQRFDYKLETSITAPYSLLCHGVGDSRAFAESYAAMCGQAGLECQVVSGTRSGESWFWNILCDDGVYYHVDLAASLTHGNFQELADWEMSGYVWDYSAYPACGKVTPPPDTEPTQESTEEPTVETQPDTAPTEETPG